MYSPGECLQIYRWVHIVYIFCIQLFPEQLAGFPKTLEMHDLPLPKEFDHVVHIRVIAEPQDVVIGDPCFLLWHDHRRTTSF